MYFANMYCYGQDNNLIGITGIRACLGVIYVGAGSMYAVHIPPHTKEQDLAAGKVFTGWVTNQEGVIPKGQGALFAFCNGNNRDTARAEIKAIKKALNGPPTTLYRIMKQLGPESGKAQAEAAVIMLERVVATEREPHGCVAWFKREDRVDWIAGGSAESGQVRVKPAHSGAEVPSDLESGWWMVDEITATSETV